jgi:hypothetical protein
MRRPTKLVLTAALMVTCIRTASAQLIVTDSATTARNTVVVGLKDSILEVLAEQYSKLKRMAMRLSLHSDLRKYAAEEPPLWRTHDFESYLYANGYTAALNYGDATGGEYERLARHRMQASAVLATVPSHVREVLDRSLATIDLADATAMAATHQTGTLRIDGRREARAINNLESDAIDPSLEQSATAVLDKISGAVLIGTRQKQARLQLLTSIVEQLLVDSKRARDTDTAALNMQLNRIRAADWGEGGSANMLAGSGQDLRIWRQP